MSDWLEVARGETPLIVAFPHTGSEIPGDLAARFVSLWLARKDADWHVDRLYDFAAGLGATTIRTRMSRSVIDVNRDPDGNSLYPGQATTELCPLSTFDGEPLYAGGAPDADEIARRRALWFAPYHAAIAAEIACARERFGHAVLYDAHAIRSRIPRLFDGELPQLNLGTNSGRSCAPVLVDRIAQHCLDSGFSSVIDGRFKGGWTTRTCGQPESGVHALQMEIACRTYLDEPAQPSPRNWPAQIEPSKAAALRRSLVTILETCRDYAPS